MPTEPVRISAPRAAPLAAVALGCAVTISIHGYRFGEGNHSIYLLDALRRANPELLANDWFTTQTLQYHALFGVMTRQLIEWRIIEPAFLAGYLALILLFHMAWGGIVRQLGGGGAAYLLALALYYLSAAGTGLGMYQFFQDSSFLPSNIANVAMLWAAYFWIGSRPALAGACLGIAGMFHLNHAVVGVGMWGALLVWEFYSIRAPSPARRGVVVMGSLLVLIPSMINILLAARVKLARTGRMPLEEFIDLFVRLRHPHHYDPSSWPMWLWIAFLWPIPLALMMLWRGDAGASRRARQVLLFMLGLQIMALLGAGVWYAGETLVQMSLYRFSIFAQLLACIAAAVWIVKRAHGGIVATIATPACAVIVAVGLIRGPFFGMFIMPTDDVDYLAVCDWARDHTPVDAIFLVPPGESSMRLRGQRGIVVNFKAVPQLSSELPQWRDRLQDVLALDDLRLLPRDYRRVLLAIDEQYASLDGPKLAAIADRYAARFIVTPRRLDLYPSFSSPNGRCFVYDRRQMEAPVNER